MLFKVHEGRHAGRIKEMLHVHAGHVKVPCQLDACLFAEKVSTKS